MEGEIDAEARVRVSLGEHVDQVREGRVLGCFEVGCGVDADGGVWDVRFGYAAGVLGCHCGCCVGGEKECGRCLSMRVGWCLG